MNPGTRIGDYVIEARIGAGGMGAVYMVQHASTKARYALKAIPLNSSPDTLLRFRREAEAQAAVDRHPNVVSIHTVGQAAGHLFLVMSLAEGGDLAARLKSGPLPWQEAVLLVQQLADGLEHVHKRGVLHRDLKPGNVLFDGQGTAKLVDFGIAFVSGAETLTQTGEVMGTPTHMAPEQVEGRRDDIDERTDVYGLGAILYHCLTGQPPFTGKSLVQVMELVRSAPPVPPTRLVESVPRWVEQVCLTALSKRSEDRYPTPRDMSTALTAGEPGRSGLPLAIAGAALAIVAAATIAGFGRGDPTGAAAVPSPSSSPMDTTPTPSRSPSEVPTTSDEGTDDGLGLRPATDDDIPDWMRAEARFLVSGAIDGDTESILELAERLRKPFPGHSAEPAMAVRWLYRLATEGNPTARPLAWTRLADVLAEEGDGRRGMLCLERGLREPRPGAVLHKQLGEFLQWGVWVPKDLARAAEHYRLGMADREDARRSGDCVLRLAFLLDERADLLQEGEARRMYEALDDLVGARPDNADAALMAGIFAERVGEIRVAVKHYERSVDAATDGEGVPKSNSLIACVRLAQLLQSAERTGIVAKKTPSDYLLWAASWGHPGAYDMLSVKSRGRHWPRVLEAIRPPPEVPPEGLLGEGPGGGEGLGDYGIGILHLSGKQPGLAASYFYAAAKAGNPAGYSQLGAQFSAGAGVARREREALRCYELAASANPPDPFGTFQLGYLHLTRSLGDSSDAGEAARLFRAGMMLATGDEVALNRVRCQAGLGAVGLEQPSLGIPNPEGLLRDAIEDLPKEDGVIPTLHLAKALFEAGLDRHEEAARLLEPFATMAPRFREAALRLLGEAFEQGQHPAVAEVKASFERR